MTDKPSHYLGYSEDDLIAVKRCCLYIATKIGDLLDDIVIVGGLVPPLLIQGDGQERESELLPPLTTPVGTKDLDLALAISLLETGRYTELSDRLRNAGFSNDENTRGNATLERWRLKEPYIVTVDFLIQPSSEEDCGGDSRHLEGDFSAFITPGLHLAFSDRKKVEMRDYTIFDEWAEREVWVCGAGAFIVLKALATRGRGENKDCYDLAHMLNAVMFDESLRNDVLSFFSEHRNDSQVQEALSIIKRDFTRQDGTGPMRAARFLRNEPDDEIQADVVGLAARLLDEVEDLTG